MEAAAAVSTVEGTTVSKIVGAKSTGINKTNIGFVTHHIGQAQTSLGRALDRLEDMTRGKKGAFAARVGETQNEVGQTITDLSKEIVSLNAVLEEAQELLG